MLQPQWASVCKAIGREDLIEDPRYDTNEKRVAASAEVIGIVQDWLDSQPSDEAIIAVQDVQVRVPRYPMHWVLALIYWEQGRFDKALEEDELHELDIKICNLTASNEEI